MKKRTWILGGLAGLVALCLVAGMIICSAYRQKAATSQDAHAAEIVFLVGAQSQLRVGNTNGAMGVLDLLLDCLISRVAQDFESEEWLADNQEVLHSLARARLYRQEYGVSSAVGTINDILLKTIGTRLARRIGP